MTDPADIVEKLTLQDDGHTLIAPCIEVVFYFYHAPHDDIRDFAEQALAALDGDLTHFVTGGMQRFAKRGKKSSDAVETMFGRPRIGAAYWLHMRGTDQGTSAAELKVSYRARHPLPTEGPAFDAIVARQGKAFDELGAIMTPPLNIIRATFPLDHPLAAPDALRNWVSGLATVQSGSFIHARAGLALNIDTEVASRPLRDIMKPAAMAALSRHPGLGEEISGDIATKLMKYRAGHADFFPRIKRVQWLTLVPALALTEFCDGAAAVKSALATSPDVQCHDLPQGAVMFQAGETPAIGDVTTGDHLPAYRAVAAALKPARMPYSNYFRMSLGRAYEDSGAAYFTALEQSVD